MARWLALLPTVAEMATAGLPFRSRTANVTDIGTLWKAATDRYETATGVKIESLTKANNLDEILGQIQGNMASFKAHRHDGSKLDRFRSLVSKSLSLIEQLSKIVATAASSVRQQIRHCLWLNDAYSNVAKGFPSEYCYLHSGQFSHTGIVISAQAA